MSRRRLSSEDAPAIEVKRALVDHLLATMKERKITKAEMTRSLRTSRSYFDRVLSLEQTTLSLSTIVRAFEMLGKAVSFYVTDIDAN
jgi:hypothetical protein